MASVFKRGRDKGKRRSIWYIAYNDQDGKRRTRKGFSDKGLTEQLAAKLEHEAMLRKRGLIDPEEERRTQLQNAPVNEHLEAFEKSLEENTSKHVKLTMTHIRRVVDGAGISTLTMMKVEKVADFLRQLKKEENLGHRTYNHYVQAIDGFCNWLVATGRLVSNPLAGLER